MDDTSDLRDLTAEQINEITLAGAKRKAREAIARGEKPKFTNGRKAALATLDFLLSRRPNIQKLYEAMQERLDVDAVSFYHDIVMPLTPKSYVEVHDVADAKSENDPADEADTSKVPRVIIQVPDNGRPKT